MSNRPYLSLAFQQMELRLRDDCERMSTSSLYPCGIIVVFMMPFLSLVEACEVTKRKLSCSAECRNTEPPSMYEPTSLQGTHSDLKNRADAE